MRLIVIGSGYVGLVAGTCLASIGHDVLCVDTDLGRIATLQGGDVPIYEPGLNALLRAQKDAGRLTFSNELPKITSEIDAVFVCVGTPAKCDGSGADLTALQSAAERVAMKAEKRVLLVIKSTVPVGTGDAIQEMLEQARPDLEASVVSNPEFLREGRAICDFLEPDRIVIGGDTGDCALVQSIYSPIATAGHPILVTSRRSAEMIKHASNAFLATRIAFINEIADLCEATEADVQEVARGMGLDHRIGDSFLRAGPGYGGSCFPKDAEALLETAKVHDVPLQILSGTIKSNSDRHERLAEKVIKACGSVSRKRVAVLGLSFKGGTDDVRQSPALALIDGLLKNNANVIAYDPKAGRNARRVLPFLQVAGSVEECIADADVAVIATEWNVFRSVLPEDAAGLMRGNIVIDLRNILDVDAWADEGFLVYGIGRTAPRSIASMRKLEDAAEWGTELVPLIAS